LKTSPPKNENENNHQNKTNKKATTTTIKNTNPLTDKHYKIENMKTIAATIIKSSFSLWHPPRHLRVGIVM
jgi:hypothetical protein